MRSEFKRLNTLPLRRINRKQHRKRVSAAQKHLTQLTNQDKALFNSAYERDSGQRHGGWLTSDFISNLVIVSGAIIFTAMLASLVAYVIYSMATNLSWMIA